MLQQGCRINCSARYDGGCSRYSAGGNSDADNIVTMHKITAGEHAQALECAWDDGEIKTWLDAYAVVGDRTVRGPMPSLQLS